MIAKRIKKVVSASLLFMLLNQSAPLSVLAAEGQTSSSESSVSSSSSEEETIKDNDKEDDSVATSQDSSEKVTDAVSSDSNEEDATSEKVTTDTTAEMQSIFPTPRALNLRDIEVPAGTTRISYVQYYAPDNPLILAGVQNVTGFLAYTNNTTGKTTIYTPPSAYSHVYISTSPDAFDSFWERLRSYPGPKISASLVDTYLSSTVLNRGDIVANYNTGVVHSGTGYMELDLKPNTTYYVWEHGANDDDFGNVTSFGSFGEFQDGGTRTKYVTKSGVQRPAPVKFTTGPGLPLTVSTPTFDQASASRDGTSITMKEGTFSGEYVSSDVGQVSLSTNNFTNNVVSTRTSISHTVPTTRTATGKYNQTVLTGLSPGTRYKAKMGLKVTGAADYTRSAASSYFYTANAMDGVPTVTSTTAATSSTNAYATVKAKYNVGADPAHPTEVKVKLRTNGDAGMDLSSTTTPKVEGYTINTSTKEVTVNLSKLKTNTNYTVEVYVKNASGVWSAYNGMSASFKPRGVALGISTPVLSDASTATEPRLQLAEGTYTGDPMVSGTSTDGIVRLYDSVGTSIDPITNLTSANGVYNATTLINGLEFGRRYTAAVWIRGSGNTREPSGRSGYVYTINSVSTPSNVSYTVPTTSSSAGVSFDGSYGVSTLAADASHPKTSGVTDNFSFDGQTGVNVQIKSDQDSDYSVWRSIKNTSTAANPAYLSSVTVNRTSKKVECSINNLKANTTYYVRYRVQNDSGKWSYFSSDSFTITTRNRANGLYVDSVPTFDFGLQQLNNGRMNLSLSHTNNSEALKVEIENVGITTGWTMAARMTPLTTQDGQTLTGAYLTFENELKSYSGGTWQPTTGVTQLTYGATTYVPATNATVSLYRTQSTNNGQGQHRLTIDPDTVKLVVPANVAHAGGIYTGNLAWTLDQLP